MPPVDDATRHRVAIGTGLGLSVVFYFLPQLWPAVPYWIAGPGVALGILFILWGVWPVIPLIRTGSGMVPLGEAARLAFEAIEGSPMGDRRTTTPASTGFVEWVLSVGIPRHPLLPTRP